jgi:hypothetical protein
MRFGRFLAAAMVLMAAAGCVSSKHALHTQKDVVFEPALLGEWRSVESDGRLSPSVTKVQKMGQSAYRAGSGNNDNRDFDLLRLGDHYFVDWCVKEGTQETHAFGKVTASGSDLKIWTIDQDWLMSLLKRNPWAVKHELHRYRDAQAKVTSESVTLTAPTEALQGFVLNHVNTPGAFKVCPFSGRYRREGKPEVPATGLLSKRQRTFDYWYEVRAIYLGSTIPAGVPANRVNPELERVASALENLPTLGVDLDAVQSSLYAAKTFRNMAAFLEKHNAPNKGAEVFIRGVLGDPLGPINELNAEKRELQQQGRTMVEKFNQTRAALTARYEMEFPGMK